MGIFGIAQAFASWHSAVVIGLLIIMSIYLVALVFARFSFFRKIEVDSSSLMSETHRALESRDGAAALAVLRTYRPTDPPVRILVGIALSNPDLPSMELTEVLSVARIRQTERLTKGLTIFGTMATIAPFVGLLGTVIGIVQSFNSLAQTGASGPNVVAGGVATALWATAAGLVVAIPSVVAYNYFRGKAKGMMTDMEVVSRELITVLRADRSVALKKAG